MTGIFYEHIIEGAEQRGISLAAALERAREIGFEALECDLWRLEDRGEAKRLFEASGFKAVSVYSTYNFPYETEKQAREKYLPHLETAAFFGAKKVLCVPGFIREGDSQSGCMNRTAERLNEMCECAEEYGITVTVEDYDDINSPCCKTAQIKFLLNNVPRLMFTFDTGNFAYCLENAEEAYRQLSRRTVHVHLKDRLRSVIPLSNGKADLSGEIMYPCPVGEGYIGIDKLIKRLAADGYKGDFSAEHFGAADQLGAMEISMENIRRLLN